MDTISSTLSYRVHRGRPIDVAPVIDAQALLTRCLGNVSFAEMLLDELESIGLSRIDEIQQQAQRRNAAGVAEAAHALKGVAGILCAESVAKHAAEIEQAARGSDLGESIESMIKDLSGEMHRCLDGLPQLREHMQLVSQKGE